MITEFARLEFELFTKPSKSDFLQDCHICLDDNKAPRSKLLGIPVKANKRLALAE